MNKDRMKKISNVLMNILLYLFLAICVFSVFVTVLSKRGPDGAAEVFGYQMRIVTSDSMAKCEYTDVSEFKIKDIPLRSMVFVKVMPTDPAKADDFYRSLKVGDVLTFRYVYTTQVTITHRVTSITEKEDGGFVIELAGDNKNSEDGQLIQTIDTSVPNNTNYVIGKVVGQAKVVGAALSFIKQPVGIIFLIMVPCAVIILLQIFKIAKVLTADKKLREQEEKDKKESELEELRRRLAEMEKAQATAMKSAEAPPAETDSKEDKEE